MERGSGFVVLVNVSVYKDLRGMWLAAQGEKSASSVGVGCDGS